MCMTSKMWAHFAYLVNSWILVEQTIQVSTHGEHVDDVHFCPGNHLDENCNFACVMHHEDDRIERFKYDQEIPDPELRV